jgi:hypothetical protein
LVGPLGSVSGIKNVAVSGNIDLWRTQTRIPHQPSTALPKRAQPSSEEAALRSVSAGSWRGSAARRTLEREQMARLLRAIKTLTLVFGPLSRPWRSPRLPSADFTQLLPEAVQELRDALRGDDLRIKLRAAHVIAQLTIDPYLQVKPYARPTEYPRCCSVTSRMRRALTRSRYSHGRTSRPSKPSSPGPAGPSGSPGAVGGQKRGEYRGIPGTGRET